jgi:5-methylcytosine-specific restriction endonuclease McrA
VIRTPCLNAGCPHMATKRSRCDFHRAQYDAERRALYGPLGRPWRRKRDAVLKAEPFCRDCGAPSQEVDHRIPRVLGGGDGRGNLAGTCTRCNRRKGARIA